MACPSSLDVSSPQTFLTPAHHTFTMKLTAHQRLLLYALGLCQERANKEFEGRPLRVVFSKIAFIELCLEAGISSIKERAIYKNLEMFEEKKLLTYTQKSVSLTERGTKAFESLRAVIDPYVTIAETFQNTEAFKSATKARAVLAA